MGKGAVSTRGAASKPSLFAARIYAAGVLRISATSEVYGDALENAMSIPARSTLFVCTGLSLLLGVSVLASHGSPRGTKSAADDKMSAGNAQLLARTPISVHRAHIHTIV